MMRILLPLVALAATLSAASPGLLTIQGRAAYPIGSYELPKDDAALKEMVDAGINLFHCNSAADLERVAKLGAQGWISLPLQTGTADGKLKKAIEAVKDHPALAAWEGPDEIVWNFTAYSGLFRNKTYPTKDEWWRQTDLARDLADRQAAEVMPKMVEATRLIRELDTRRHPIWINEAARSDLAYMRQYMESIDITGCDIYPVLATKRALMEVADFTDRFRKAGYGRPVWMVLQGFAWGTLQGFEQAVTYPTFAETRAMAWAAVTHRARGVLYWGMNAAPMDPGCRQSLYAMTAELAAVQPFLVAPEASDVKLELIDSEEFTRPARGVSYTARWVNGEWLVVLVNEDDRAHYGVVVSGLRGARQLDELYTKRSAEVRHGELVTRLLPYEVKVFATGRKWECQRRQGRDYVRP
jgi:hypothetical protein